MQTFFQKNLESVCKRSEKLQEAHLGSIYKENIMETITNTKQPKVTMVNHTSRPLETLAWVCKIYTQLGLDSIDKLRDLGLDTDEKMIEFLQPFLAEPSQSFMEYIDCIFIIEHVSRAFQQQLTRHRLASFAIQSLRVFDVGRFADEGRYTIPSTVKDKASFQKQMREVQKEYNTMVRYGENLEDARGILPLNIHSTITMKINFNALRHVLQGRLCLTAQEEARKVGYLIKAAVTEKMGSFFGNLLQPPCHQIYGGECTRPHFYCGIPLPIASSNPEMFGKWMNTTGGKPDGARVPTSSVVLPDDVPVFKTTERLSRAELDSLIPLER